MMTLSHIAFIRYLENQALPRSLQTSPNLDVKMDVWGRCMQVHQSTKLCGVDWKVASSRMDNRLIMRKTAGALLVRNTVVMIESKTFCNWHKDHLTLS